MAEIKPPRIVMAEYTPTKSLQPSCSTTFVLPTTSTAKSGERVTTTLAIRLSTNLPPKPDTIICNCMMNSLTCIQQDGEKDNEPLDWRSSVNLRNSSRDAVLDSAVCSQNETWCLGAISNVEDGRYGAFSACNYTERTSWALNQLYMGRGNNSDACTAAGGLVRTPLTSQSRNCQFLLQQAKADGTGIVTQTALTDDFKDGEQAKRNGISTIAKAGIGVAIVVIFVLVATGLLTYWRRKRVTSKSKSAHAEVAELPNSVILGNKIVEIGGEERREIGGDEVVEGEVRVITEMPTEHNNPVELDATERYRR